MFSCKHFEFIVDDSSEQRFWFTLTVGHDENEQAAPLPADNPNAEAVSANSLHTTAYDFALFMCEMVNDKSMHEAFDFNKAVPMTKDPWAVETVPDADLQKVRSGLGWVLQKTDDGDTIAFHWGDMGESKGFAAINIDKKEGVVYLTNSFNGLSIAQDLTSNTVKGLDAGLSWMCKKYGYIPHTEPNWKWQQKHQTWHHFAKYEIAGFTANWVDDLKEKSKLDVVSNSPSRTLTVKCEPKSLFARISVNQNLCSLESSTMNSKCLQLNIKK